MKMFLDCMTALIWAAVGCVILWKLTHVFCIGINCI